MDDVVPLTVLPWDLHEAIAADNAEKVMELTASAPGRHPANRARRMRYSATLPWYTWMQDDLRHTAVEDGCTESATLMQVAVRYDSSNVVAALLAAGGRPAGSVCGREVLELAADARASAALAVLLQPPGGRVVWSQRQLTWALADAAWGGCVGDVSALLAAGADARGERQGHCALSWAVVDGALVHAPYRRGADDEDQDARAHAAVAAALSKIRALAAGGAHAGPRASRVLPLQRAAQERYPPAVLRALVEEAGADVNARDGFGSASGYTALHWGVRDERTARALLELRADPNARSGPRGDTPLLALLSRPREPPSDGGVAVTCALLAAGADPALPQRRGWRGRTAAMHAAALGHADALRAILEHVAAQQVAAASPAAPE